MFLRSKYVDIWDVYFFDRCQALKQPLDNYLFGNKILNSWFVVWIFFHKIRKKKFPHRKPIFSDTANRCHNLFTVWQATQAVSSSVQRSSFSPYKLRNSMTSSPQRLEKCTIHINLSFNMHVHVKRVSLLHFIIIWWITVLLPLLYPHSHCSSRPFHTCRLHLNCTYFLRGIYIVCIYIHIHHYLIYF